MGIELWTNLLQCFWRFGPDQLRNNAAGGTGGEGPYSSSAPESSLLNRHQTQLANSSAAGPGASGVGMGIGSSVSSAAAAASMSFAQRFGLSSGNYFSGGGMGANNEFDVTRGYGASAYDSQNPTSRGADSASTPGSSSTNPSSSNHYSALQEWVRIRFQNLRLPCYHSTTIPKEFDNEEIYLSIVKLSWYSWDMVTWESQVWMRSSCLKRKEFKRCCSNSTASFEENGNQWLYNIPKFIFIERRGFLNGPRCLTLVF